MNLNKPQRTPLGIMCTALCSTLSSIAVFSSPSLVAVMFLVNLLFNSARNALCLVAGISRLNTPLGLLYILTGLTQFLHTAAVTKQATYMTIQNPQLIEQF